MEDNNEVEVGRIPKGSRNFIIAKVSEFFKEGMQAPVKMIGIRTWFMPDADDPGNLKPTKNGMSVTLAFFGEYAAFIQDLHERYEAGEFDDMQAEEQEQEEETSEIPF